MSDTFIIKGSARARTLEGEIAVKGAKNAALKAFPASVLFRDAVRLRNVPDIGDIAQMKILLEGLGAHILKRGNASYTIVVPHSVETNFPRLIAKRFRASIVAVGPTLARFGKVSFPHPGGCLIGARPIDIFLDGFAQMGARFERRGEIYTLRVPKKKLRGATIFFKNQTVTATETFMMAGVLAEGTTVLKNAAIEPEVESLADFLNACGARIKGAGTSVIAVKGGGLLRAGGRSWTMLPDRIEAGSFLILGALAAKDLRIVECEPAHLEALLGVLRLSGVSFEIGKTSIRIRRNPSPARFHSVDVKTHEYPGFPTDLQSLITVFLSQVKGKSTVFETIFEGRFRYAEELARMGADIKECDPHRIIVHGPTPLRGKELQSPDLRAGLAYIIAGMVAKGTSVIHNVENIDRGYERIDERLRGIGMNIKRII